METNITSIQKQKFPLAKDNIKQKLFESAYYFIVAVLLFSGFSKIIDPENFLKTLNTTLNFLGESIIIFIATALPVIEIAIGLMLLLKIKTKETLFVVVILFAAFLLFSIYGTIAGFDVDCGCFGSSVGSEFGVEMIVRNLILLIISLILIKTSLLEQKLIINYLQTKRKDKI